MLEIFVICMLHRSEIFGRKPSLVATSPSK